MYKFKLYGDPDISGLLIYPGKITIPVISYCSTTVLTPFNKVSKMKLEVDLLAFYTKGLNTYFNFNL